jgi:hypothetical protein
MGLHLETLGTKRHLGDGPMAMRKVYYKGEGGGFPKSKPWWVLWVCVCPWFVHASKVHQKCFSYALTNLLSGLCKSVWVIDLLINLPSPHFGAPACPSTPEVLWARECAQFLLLSLFSPFGLVVSPSRCLGVGHYLHGLIV